MKRTSVIFLAFLSLFATKSSAQTAVKIGDITITADGTGWDITVVGTVTLDQNAQAITGHTFYFRDPNKNVVPATIINWTPPDPGKTTNWKIQTFPVTVHLSGRGAQLSAG